MDRPWHGLLIFLAGIQIASVPICSYSHELNLLKIPQIIALLLACCWLLSSIKMIKEINFPITLILYLLFGLWCGVTLIFHPYSEGFMFYLSLLKVIGITLIIGNIVTDQKALQNILLIFSLSIIIVFWLNKGEVEKIYAQAITERLSGTLGNANIFGMYAVAVMWSSFTYWLGSKSTYRHIILLLMPLALYISIYSGSRKALIALFLFSIFVTYLTLVHFKKSFFIKMILVPIIFCCFLIVVYLIYNSPFYFRLERLWSPESIKSGTSAAQRIALFSSALKLWAQNPLLGLGFEQFRYRLGTYSHSTVSETLVSTGLVGFLIYFGCLANLCFNLIKTINREIDSTSRLILLSLGFWIIIFIFFNVFAVMYVNRFMWPIIGAISGYISSRQRQLSMQESKLT